MQSTDNLILNICSNIKILLRDYSALQENNDILNKQIAQLRVELEEKGIELENKQKEISKIETGQALQNDVLRRETKSKIDELITMIDECIESLDK